MPTHQNSNQRQKHKTHGTTNTPTHNNNKNQQKKLQKNNTNK
ncbi:hypothetical protein [Methanobrevibacter arboriphilus]|nr:hypothetical protein [Methanobrevibacter arboriphilus]